MFLISMIEQCFFNSAYVFSYLQGTPTDYFASLPLSVNSILSLDPFPVYVV